jgi:GH24 family phage-related lysozyme (muramidase)
MNIDKLREEITFDEGVVYKVYLDHLGLPTFGIGHLVTKNDEEYGEDVGYPVSEQRVIDVFEEDMKTVLKDCKILYDDFDELPEECQHIIANMMFNMGRPRLSKFKGMKRGVDARDWNAAADEMVDSRWYRQVTKRADRLVARMRALEIDD